jgi:dihydroorotate dehydrogenase
MLAAMANALMPLLRRIDPERAHGLAIRALRLGLAGRSRASDDSTLAMTAFGLRFTNPIGLAAGFDKGAVAARPLMRLGFGFVETGTVTPLPQPGNPKPRLFRLDEDLGAINRNGFNSAGLEAYLRELRRLSDRPVPLGANIGINKEGADPPLDYPALIEAVAPFVDYAVINISSPNTPGLRDLQGEARLREILENAAKLPRRPPILIKLAPDLADDGLAAAVETCVSHGVAGIIVGNTTISRPTGLRSPNARETGGLSGKPLFALSNRVLARAFLLSRGRLALIGAGGVFSGADALTKIRAGASLVQLYTAFAYHGPTLIPRLKAELASALREAGFARVEDAVGTRAQELAEW